MADAASPASPLQQEGAVLRQRVAMVQEQVERPKTAMVVLRAAAVE